MDSGQDFDKLLSSLTSLSLEAVEVEVPIIENSDSLSPRFPWDELDNGDEGRSRTNNLKIQTKIINHLLYYYILI